ncbi:hypothetical protein R83H12_00723 [Fibrobacteria bacterium R8-3-H12]
MNRANRGSDNLADAIKAVIKTCLSKNILVSFLREHGSEIENMIYGEWNMDEALAVRYEDGREDSVLNTAKNMLAKGFSVADVLKATDLPSEQIMSLRQTVVGLNPNFNHHTNNARNMLWLLSLLV